jgi:hypothetical protein
MKRGREDSIIVVEEEEEAPAPKKTRIGFYYEKPVMEPLTEPKNISISYLKGHASARTCVNVVCNLQSTRYHHEVCDTLAKMPFGVRSMLAKCLAEGLPLPAATFYRYISHVPAEEWGTWTIVSTILDYVSLPDPPQHTSTPDQSTGSSALSSLRQYSSAPLTK